MVEEGQKNSGKALSPPQKGGVVNPYGLPDHKIPEFFVVENFS